MILIKNHFTWTISFFFLSILFSSVASVTIPDNEHSGSNSSTQLRSQVIGSFRFLENSGVCETTPGVKTYSGYIEIGKNQSMFFWFFEARNNPRTAPFALWINGGPGCSSMIGLFQENGPCTISADGKTSLLNPHSWNEYAHMIYVDQPIGTGFSYGKNDVYTTPQAAIEIWQFFQLLFDTKPFATYESREFGLWTESYGGRYGPIFAEYFDKQNEMIKAGKLKAHSIRLTTLGINNGWFDPLIQYPAYLDFAQAKFNGFFDFVDQRTLDAIKSALFKDRGCVSLLKECYKSGASADCKKADAFCTDQVANPAIGNQNGYYFPNNASDEFPSISFLDFLDRPEIIRAIGAASEFSVCADDPYNQFKSTGDAARSTIPSLANMLNKGLQTLIWAGDLDFICNWLGGYRAIEAMPWKSQAAFRAAPWKNLEIGGSMVGIYKTAGPLTYARIFGAGHEVAAYKPAISLEIFKQTMRHQTLHNVN